MKKDVGNIDGGMNALEALSLFDKEETTSEAVSNFTKNPTIENQEHATSAINDDIKLNAEQKGILIDELKLVKKDIQNTFKTIPKSPSKLDEECRYLAGLTKTSAELSSQAFYSLCIRLQLMKSLSESKGKSYFPKGITGGIKQYSKEILDLSRTTVYEYLDLYTLFTVSARADTDINVILKNRSKLRYYFPILRSDKLSDDVKETIAEDAIRLAVKNTRKECIKDAKAKQIEYEIKTKPIETNITLENAIDEIKKGYREGKVMRKILWK